jgi:hypothetical protein
MAESEKNMV